mmetsp:Transcript_3601/g.14161  ORF Transcript_3601/g.14161 Transcript_3601/m.14161 type:complete len:156 (+) Transcript_3601:78-545(+)
MSRDSASNQLERFAKLQAGQSTATVSSGAPADSLSASRTAGARGPIVLEDFNLVDSLAHFDRERIPERVVHAKGAGAFGYFEVTSPEGGSPSGQWIEMRGGLDMTSLWRFPQCKSTAEQPSSTSLGSGRPWQCAFRPWAASPARRIRRGTREATP